MKRLAAIAAFILCIAGALGGIAYYLTHHVDWARVYYKRLKAPNAYVYNEVAPFFKKTDPAKLIRIRSRETAERVRHALTKAIWGSDGLPAEKLPQSFDGTAPDALSAIPGVASVRQLRVPVDLGFSAYIYVLEPANPNGRLVFYQNGYASTVQAMAPLFAALVAQGYTVAANNYPEYGPNQFPLLFLERFGWYTLSHDRVVSVHPHPMRFYIEPVVVALNGLLQSDRYSRIDLVGFSGGGWIATIAAAVDRRIASTYTVAGGYPLYLRLDNFERQSPPPQLYQPLLMAANYLEMYVLAADGGERELVQIFNRYDRCCYRNTLGKLYETAVREAVSKIGNGRFRVLIDETHADHKVSDWAIARITEGLAAVPQQAR